MTESWFADGIVDLVTFELLEQIARTGSLTAAATAMGVSQQAASARLVRAERLLGLPLVHRAVGGSVLTEHGGMVLEWAVPVLDAARRAAVSLDALRHRDAPLTVAASQTVAEFLLPGWLQSLRKADPGAAVRLVSGNSADVVERVRSGAAQLGFIEGPDAPDGLHGVVVALDELAVVVAPDHPWVRREVVPAADLASTPLLLRERGSGTRATFEAWLRDRGLSVALPPAAELGTTSAIRAAAMAGVAPAVLSRRAVLDDVVAGRLHPVALDGPAPRRRLAAIWAGPRLAALPQALVEIARRAEEANGQDRA